VIGSYTKPKVRLPGSGGSAEIAAWANRTYLITPHQARRFPARCDFVTGAGGLEGHGARKASGVRGAGPAEVVTDIGLLAPDADGELILTALHPGRTAEEACANTGWPLRLAEQLKQTEPPTPDELRLLREELDPTGIYLKGAA
jgi:glutaconate CoA-transferase subunit B